MAFCTSLANSGGRVGHQLNDLVTGIIVSECFGIHYLHSPLRDAKWDNFFGFGMRQPSAASDEYAGLPRHYVNYHSRWNGLSYEELSAALASMPTNGVLVFQKAARVLLQQAYEWHAAGLIASDVATRVRNLLRDRFWSVPRKVDMADMRFADARLQIAMHVRSGDATPENHRFLPTSYYVGLLRQIRDLFAASDAVIHVYSAGHVRQMRRLRSELEKYDGNIVYHLNTNPFASFHGMASADCLALSHSSFSDWAGILSMQPKMLHPHFHMRRLGGADWFAIDGRGRLAATSEVGRLVAAAWAARDARRSRFSALGPVGAGRETT